jgi:hypothetical protein
MNENPEIELNLDYMLTLKMSFEIELESDDNPVSLIRLVKQMYRFLKNQRKSNAEIKRAIDLLYTEIDPANKDDALYILDRTISTDSPVQFHTSATFVQMLQSLNNADDQLSNELDRYTGEFINAPAILNMFENNLNNLHYFYTSGPSGPFGSLIVETPDEDGATGENSSDGLSGPTGIYEQDDDTETEEAVELSPNATLLLAGHNYYNNYNMPLINTFVYRGFYNALMNGVGNNTGLEDIKNIATTEILDKNTTIIKHDDPAIKDNCSICLEGYEQDSIIRKLNCSHIFHKDCIDPWLLKESYKCPICRNDSLPHTHT